MHFTYSYYIFMFIYICSLFPFRSVIQLEFENYEHLSQDIWTTWSHWGNLVSMPEVILTDQWKKTMCSDWHAPWTNQAHWIHTTHLRQFSTCEILERNMETLIFHPAQMYGNGTKVLNLNSSHIPFSPATRRKYEGEERSSTQKRLGRQLLFLAILCIG